MTPLRRRMNEAMILRGFAPRTREAYLACVIALANHYHRPPDQFDAGEIQAYLLHLITEKKLAYASVNQAACAFRFFYEGVLRRPNARLDIPMAKRRPNVCPPCSPATRSCVCSTLAPPCAPGCCS